MSIQTSVDFPETIRPRRVNFAWEQTPLHWIPNDPFTTHLINVLHLLLPAGEQWFVDVYKEALPLITDAKLRSEVRGFMGQEAIHARAHAAVLDHVREQGIETEPYTKRVDWILEKLLGSDRAPRFLQRRWLRFRLAVIAAIEHYTCMMADWIVMNSAALDAAGADPTMLDLVRWHGAEEVEHRSVAFDTFEHVAGWDRYLMRIEAMLIITPVFLYMWYAGVKFFMANDPTISNRRATFRQYLQSAKKHLVPGWELVRAVPRYLRPSHHPTREGSLQAALNYLAISPAARAAQAAGAY